MFLELLKNRTKEIFSPKKYATLNKKLKEIKLSSTARKNQGIGLLIKFLLKKQI